MKEAEIASYILQLDARNLQLKRRLAERGIDWRSECDVICRFRAETRQHGLRLQQQLRSKGFANIELLPGVGDVWRVHAQGRQSLEHAASHEFTEEMVRTAAALSCFYDGWQATISPGEA